MTSWNAALTRPFKQYRLNIFTHVCVLVENVNPRVAEHLTLCSASLTNISVSVPLAAAHPTQSLPWPPASKCQTYRWICLWGICWQPKSPFCSCLIIFNDCQSLGADWRYSSKALEGNISLADAKSIKQHQGAEKKKKKRWDLSVTKPSQLSVGDLWNPLRSLPVEQRCKPKEKRTKKNKLQMTTEGLWRTKEAQQDNPSRQEEDTEGHTSRCPNVKQTRLWRKHASCTPGNKAGKATRFVS